MQTILSKHLPILYMQGLSHKVRQGVWPFRRDVHKTENVILFSSEIYKFRFKYDKNTPDVIRAVAKDILCDQEEKNLVDNADPIEKYMEN